MNIRQQTSSRTVAARRNAVTDADPRLWQCFYLVLTLTMGMVFLWTLSTGNEVSLSLRLIVIALLVLTLKRWTGALMLALIQVHLWFPDPWNFGPTGPFDSFLWVMFSLVLLLAVSRYRSLQDLDTQSVLITLRRLVATNSAGDANESVMFWQNLRAVLRHLLRSVLVILVCAILARFLMSLVPLNPIANGITIREYRLRPTGYRVLMLGLTIFAIFLPIRVLVAELARRRLSRQQAGIYLRSIFLSWIHRDLRMIIRKRLKTRQARARAMEPVSRDKAELQPPIISTEKG